jgi:RNA polymerase sigma-70 factor (ECF subfamily)
LPKIWEDYAAKYRFFEFFGNFQVQNQLQNITVDDKILVQKCQNGDSDAMQRLIIRYQDRIYNTILKICGNRDDAAELTQETFVKVIENINTFKGQSAFYTWLFRVAVNLTFNYCKRRFKLENRSLDAPAGPGYDDAAKQLGAFLADKSAEDPAVLAQKKETGEIIMSCLARLDDAHRAVLVLRDIEGLSYAEIGDILEIELGTVKSRLSRARANLREIFETVL